MTITTRTSTLLILALLFAGGLLATPAQASSGVAGFDTQSTTSMMLPIPMIPCSSSSNYWTVPSLLGRAAWGQGDRITSSFLFETTIGTRPKQYKYGTGQAQSPMFAAANASPLETLAAWSSASSAAKGAAEQLAIPGRKPYEPEFWATFYGGGQHFQDHGQVTGGKVCTIGFVVGAHLITADEFVLGFLMGYERNNADIAHGGGNGKMESFRFGPYMVKQFDNWFTHVELTAGIHSTNYDRDSFGAENKGSFKSCDISLSTTVGYDIKVCPSTVLRPFVSANYTYLSRQGFAETGFTPTAMRFGSMQESILTTKLGVKVSHNTLLCGKESRVGVHGALAHNCFFGNNSFSSNPVLNYGPNGGEQGAVRGPQDYFIYGAHLEWSLTENSFLTFRYDGQANNGFYAHFGSLNYRIAL